jgi:hypothetical protein
MLNMQPARSDLVRWTSIPRIAFTSQQDLATHLDGQTRPFIATGCIGSWLATQEWTPDYFVERYGDFPVTASVDLPTQGVPYALSPAEHLLRTSMAEFVRRMDDAPKPSYLHQLSVKQFPGLQSATAFDALLPPSSRNINLYFWLGSGGTRSGLHFDRFDNINAQIFGRKSVLLLSPEQSAALYPFDDNIEKSQVDPDQPDLDRFPRFSDIRPMTAVIEPGELLFIPRLWWHHLRSLEPAINVNCWYGEHISLGSMLRVVNQGGIKCWSKVIRDFLSCGLLGLTPRFRLFSDPPTGKVLYDVLAGALKRRLLIAGSGEG